jgi:integrase
MTDTPAERYQAQKNRLWGSDDDDKEGHVESGRLTNEEAERIEELCNAFDSEKLDRQAHTEKKQSFDKDGDRSYSTLWGWMYRLARIGRDLKKTDTAESLLSADVSDINDLMERYYDGDVPKCSGLTKGTIQTYQFSLRMFYRYHSDLGIESEHIAVYANDKDSAVDPDDMLSKEEIEQLKAAANHPRDKMLFELLLYTGMRDNAVRTLRVKDIDFNDSSYQFNSEVDHGLKGADERNGRRPLLLAKGSVRQWINQYHPARDRDDFEECYLVTGKPAYSRITPKQPIANNTIRATLRKLKEEAEIDKPLNPHALRHNFVTICIRDYSLKERTVKYLIGHSKDSNVMETTYSHLSDEDFMRDAEAAFDLREEEEHSTLTPKECNCGAKVEPTAKACSNCGMVFTPDAITAQDTVDDVALNGMREAEDDTEADAVEQFRDYLKNNPEEAVEILQEEL